MFDNKNQPHNREVVPSEITNLGEWPAVEDVFRQYGIERGLPPDEIEEFLNAIKRRRFLHSRFPSLRNWPVLVSMLLVIIILGVVVGLLDFT